MIRVRTSTGAAAIKAIRVRRPGGETKAVFAGSLRNTVALKRFFTQSGSITATATPPTVSAYTATGSTATIVTASVTVAPSNGSSPYTYAWTLISSDGGTWSAQTPTTATTKFVCSGVGPGAEYAAVFRCTVTDSVGGTGTVDVEADVTNLGSLYP